MGNWNGDERPDIAVAGRQGVSLLLNRIRSDEDGDGFCTPEDCDDTDPDINPDGMELPGNYVDENCDGDLGDCSPCREWQCHGEYIQCIASVVNDLLESGIITEEEGTALVNSAGRSDVGKKKFVPPPECTP